MASRMRDINNMLKPGSAGETASCFNTNCPMNDVGRRAVRGNWKKLIAGKSYKITYQDRTSVNNLEWFHHSESRNLPQSTNNR